MKIRQPVAFVMVANGATRAPALMKVCGLTLNQTFLGRVLPQGE